MKNMAMVILVGVLSLGLSFSALAGMNHQPHSVKTFMGKERKVKTEVAQAEKEKAGARAGKIHINPFQKGPGRISRR